MCKLYFWILIYTASTLAEYMELFKLLPKQIR